MSPDPARTILAHATAYATSAALHAAMALNVADHLFDGSADAATLARLTGADEDALFRLLRLLASQGVFSEVAPRRFALNPAGDLLRKSAPQSLYGIAYFLADPFHFRAYANLLGSVMTRRPAVEATVGEPLFAYLAHHPEYAAVFNDAMTALSAPVIGAALEAYDFGRFRTLVDVGGGHGEVMLSILKAYPEARGVVADLAHVAEGAKTRIAADGLANRCRATACDFFVSVPAGGDAYVMKHILHDWDDARGTVILENIATAMGDNRGTVILLESVIAPGDAPDLAKSIDIEMLVMPGGRERSADEFEALLASAGFMLSRVIPTRSPLSVIEAIRAGS